MNNQDLIVVKQLPLIEEHLKTLSEAIDAKVENAKSLVCTEETVKTVKQVRADLNKEFKELENQRKIVKEQILAPYVQFEEVYKQYVSDKYKNADSELKSKVDNVESELKANKEQEIKNYFEEYKEAQNIDFVTYEQAKINVTLTASMKSLKEQAKTFIDRIVDDLKLIETQENKAEILVEYKQTLNVSNAITTVVSRTKAIEAEQDKLDILKEACKEVFQEDNSNERKEPQNANEVTANQEEKVYTITFKVTGTAPKLKQLKQYLLDGGFQYE